MGTGAGDMDRFQDSWALTKQETTDVGDDVEVEEISDTFTGYANLCSHFGKHYGGVIKVKNWTIQWQNNCTAMYLPEGHKDIDS